DARSDLRLESGNGPGRRLPGGGVEEVVAVDVVESLPQSRDRAAVSPRGWDRRGCLLGKYPVVVGSASLKRGHDLLLGRRIERVGGNDRRAAAGCSGL